MQSHRSTQARVSKDTEHSNFDAGTALENLRAEVVDIEALARAAEAAAEALPMPANDRQRVVFGRILSLGPPRVYPLDLLSCAARDLELHGRRGHLCRRSSAKTSEKSSV